VATTRPEAVMRSSAGGSLPRGVFWGWCSMAVEHEGKPPMLPRLYAKRPHVA
jgi:hypothetical protein